MGKEVYQERQRISASRNYTAKDGPAISPQLTGIIPRFNLQNLLFQYSDRQTTTKPLRYSPSQLHLINMFGGRK
jgi:hypothetical protein